MLGVGCLEDGVDVLAMWWCLLLGAAGVNATTTVLDDATMVKAMTPAAVMSCIMAAVSVALVRFDGGAEDWILD